MVVPSGTLVSMPSMVTLIWAPMELGGIGGAGSRSGCINWLSGARRRWRVPLSLMCLLPCYEDGQSLGDWSSVEDLVLEVLQDRHEGYGAGLTETALGRYLHAVGQTF